MSKRVLILCTGNSCRSQMAEVIWNSISEKHRLGWQAVSAGSKPSGYVHPMSIVAMKEKDLSTEGLESKSSVRLSMKILTWSSRSAATRKTLVPSGRVRNSCSIGLLKIRLTPPVLTRRNKNASTRFGTKFGPRSRAISSGAPNLTTPPKPTV